MSAIAAHFPQPGPVYVHAGGCDRYDGDARRPTCGR